MRTISGDVELFWPLRPTRYIHGPLTTEPGPASRPDRSCSSEIVAGLGVVPCASNISTYMRLPRAGIARRAHTAGSATIRRTMRSSSALWLCRTTDGMAAVCCALLRVAVELVVEHPAAQTRTRMLKNALIKTQKLSHRWQRTCGS